MKWSFILLYTMLGYSMETICQEKFEGYLVYSYRNEYRNKSDSIKYEKQLQAFFENTGIEIGKRKTGVNKCYVKKDTLMMALYDKGASIPLKHNIQIGKCAYIEDLLTGGITELSKSNMERIFDENLKVSWEDSISINQIFIRDYSKFKQKRQKQLMKGYQCELYEHRTNKDTYEKYWVSNKIVNGINENLPIHFETIFFDGRLIIKKEAYHNGRIVIHELEGLKIGEIRNLEKALLKSNIDLIKLE